MTVQMELDRLKEASGTETGSPYHSVLKAVASFALMVVDYMSKIVDEQRVVDDGGILVMVLWMRFPLFYQLICVA
jgi:hypothetical protein